MLRYLNKGLRYYGTRDIHPPDHCRNNWEIMVVSKGQARPLIYQATPPPMAGQMLWLLPPESRHCWESPPHSPCQVYVFHFASIHPLLVSVLPSNRTLSVGLNAKDLKAIDRIYDAVEDDYMRPMAVSLLSYEIAMLELSKLILQHDRLAVELPDFDFDGERVLQAMHWHREHMAKGVKVSDVSAALKISSAHLRRLFLRVRNETPQQAFAKAKVQEACRLMSATKLSMKEIAARCGFQGFSEFYRFFHKHTGQAPTQWKQNDFYDKPLPKLSKTPLPAKKRR